MDDFQRDRTVEEVRDDKSKVEALYTRLGAPREKRPIGQIEAGTLYTRLGDPTYRKEKRREREVNAVGVKI